MAIKLALWAALAVASGSASAVELSAECKPLFDAMEKTIRSDHSTTTVREGNTIQGVSVGGTMYVQIQGAWRKSPMSVQDVLAQTRENLKNAKEYRCQRGADAIVDGTPSTIYKTHTVSEFGSGDATVAIAKGSGLAVQVENTMTGEANMRFVTRYSYVNVKPPM